MLVPIRTLQHAYASLDRWSSEITARLLQQDSSVTIKQEHPYVVCAIKCWLMATDVLFLLGAVLNPFLMASCFLLGAAFRLGAPALAQELGITVCALAADYPKVALIASLPFAYFAGGLYLGSALGEKLGRRMGYLTPVLS